MFLCGNMCTKGTDQPEITVNRLQLPNKIHTSIQTKFNKAKKQSYLRLRKSKFRDYLEECKSKKTKFTDKQFMPNKKNLDFRVEGRSIVWKRAGQIFKDCVMAQDQFKPQDICQGNLKDCYFLSSVAAIAQVQERISNIFHENFAVCQQGIYKLIVVKQGVPSQMVIDDFIPVFTETNRPVFCKPTRQQIWVMLIQKAWAKIKGSYGAISSGCPHQVLNTFLVAPCYFYQINENQDQEYREFVWQKLTQAAGQLMPIVAGTGDSVKVQSLLPFHAYTVIDCRSIPSYGKLCRLVKITNPWSKIEYNGYASKTDKAFWDGVPQEFKLKFRALAEASNGDVILPFDEFIKNFVSIDISNFRFGFSYEFQQLKMPKNEPLFVRINVKEAQQGYITIKRYETQASSQDVIGSTYGFSRIIVALQRDFQTLEYYGSMLQSDILDLNLWLSFKPGSYLIMVETDDPNLTSESQCTFGYYFDSVQQTKSKQITVEYGKQYPNFLEQVWMNHAIRMNTQKSKIGPKPEDWIKTSFLYNEGGYGYVLCNLQHDTNIRMSVTVNKSEISHNGFHLLGQHPPQQVLTAGDSTIFIFSCNFQDQKINNIVFPPPGFKLLRIA